MKLKIIILVSIVILLFSCEKKDEIVKAKLTSVCRSEIFYLPENFIPGTINSIKVKDEYIYITGIDDENFARLYRYNIDGTNPTVVENIHESNIVEYIINDTKTAYIEIIYGQMNREKIKISLFQNDDELFSVDADNIFDVRIIDIPFDPYVIDGFDVKNIVSANGFYYIASTNKIAVLDKNGNRIGIINSNNPIDKLFINGDDILVLSHNSTTNKSVINYINKMTNQIGEDLNLPNELTGDGMNASILIGVGYDFYIKNNSGLYGYNIGGDIAEVVNWINSDLIGNQMHVMEILSPSEFLYISGNSLVKNLEFGKLTLISQDEYIEKTILTLAKMYKIGNLEEQVVNFNKQNENFRIVIKDYSAYDHELRAMRLNTDIASGYIPDIFAFNNYSYDNEYPIRNYINQGLFMDLQEMFERDESVSIDILHDIVRNAFVIDDKLYMLPRNLTTRIFIGKKSNFDFNTWTPTEMLEYSESLNDNIILTQNIFSYMWNYNILNYYIDIDNKKFNYDDILKTLIKYRAEAFENYRADNISYTERMYMFKTDMLLLRDYTISDFRSIVEMKYIFEDDITYIGYPAMSGNGSTIQSSGYYSIAQQSDNLEGAWEFIKFFLSQDEELKNSPNLHSDYIPVTKIGMEKMVEKYLESTFAFIGDGSEVYSNPMTEKDILDLETRSSFYKGEYELVILIREEIEELIYMFSTLKPELNADITLQEIFLEEMSAYYDDIRDEVYDEAIRVIKNRIELYLNEQY